MAIVVTATLIFAVLSLNEVSHGAPTISRSNQRTSFGEIDALMFLQKYGYLPEDGGIKGKFGLLLSEERIQDAIEVYQTFSGLPVTGKLDEATAALMRTPRCGVKDVPSEGHRKKRYILQGSRWPWTWLSYAVANYPSRARPSDVDDAVARAFDLWGAASALRFVRESDPLRADIEVRFESGPHDACDPFDGRGGTLGHAYYPEFGGAAHFDADEAWSHRVYRGTNLFQVAAHEFGHSLGLWHSEHPDAVMAPVYRQYDPDFALHPDDIEAIQTLYGEPPANTDTDSFRNEINSEEKDESLTSPAPTILPLRDICKDAKIDTIFSNAGGETIVLKGEEYYKLCPMGVEQGYPQPIAEELPGLPAHIDAAFTYRNGKTYFFKGEQYWRYEGRKMDGDFPKLISDSFPGIPNNVDAAMMWSDGRIYFFKDNEYWRYDPSAFPTVADTYPKPIEIWRGIPNNIDGVHVHDGYTYFFKGGDYYRFDDFAFEVDMGSPPFPRPLARWWFGCGRPEQHQSTVAAK